MFDIIYALVRLYFYLIYFLDSSQNYTIIKILKDQPFNFSSEGYISCSVFKTWQPGEAILVRQNQK